MRHTLTPALATLAALLAAQTLAAEVDTGSIPATKPQMDTLQQRPEDVTTTRSPEPRGAMTKDMPTSPHQTQVLEGTTPTFSAYDTNGNGKISASEGKRDPQLESEWSQLDRNGDNHLDRAEFAAFEAQQIEQNQ